jgi:uncharacterized protein YfdQ (DUF2303 family)
VDNAAAVEAVAELARSSAFSDSLEPFDVSPESSVVIRAVRNDHRIETIDLEHLLARPRAAHGSVTVHAPADFVRYVTARENESTTVWAWQDGLTVTAVFNDHTREEPGWRDHVAHLKVEREPDWEKWRKLDGCLVDQVTFAEHIEDQTHVIVEPDAATMLEVANTFHAHRTSTFSQKIKVESGDIQLAWTDETTAQAGSGRVDVPRVFLLCLPPFVGVAPIEVRASLRYRVKDGRLGLGFRLLRTAEIERKAFVDILAEITNGLTAPVLLGSAPSPGR